MEIPHFSRSMKKSVETCIGRSEGDGMENVCLISAPEARLHSNGKLPKHREPKFVPYEPYKAAVCPLEQLEKINALEEKVKSLEKENQELKSQNQVQAEVNCDLKKLLLAAMGEDAQLQVQGITEDKAMLGKEVLRLSQELHQAQEDADLYRNKYQTSSAIVKELAHWKGSLSRRLREAFRGINSLLEEHDFLFEKLSASHRVLENSAAAFDGFPRDTSPRKLHLLQLCSEVHSLSSNIQEQLLGRIYCNKVASRPQVQYLRQLTRAENLVHQIFLLGLVHPGRSNPSRWEVYAKNTGGSEGAKIFDGTSDSVVQRTPTGGWSWKGSADGKWQLNEGQGAILTVKKVE